MFSKPDFQTWGKASAVLFAAVMTRIDGRKDDALLRTYGFTGFPSLAVLDADGTALTKKVGRDLFAMATATAAATDHAALAAKVGAGDEVDRAAWFMARLGVGELELEPARAEMADLELTEAQRASAEQQLLVMEVGQLLRGRDATEVADKVYALHKAGKRLPAGSSLAFGFDSKLLEGAKKAGDGAAYLAAMPSVKEQLEEQVRNLEELLPKYQDNQRALESLRSSLEATRKNLADIDATAAAFRKNGPDR